MHVDYFYTRLNADTPAGLLRRRAICSEVVQSCTQTSGTRSPIQELPLQRCGKMKVTPLTGIRNDPKVTPLNDQPARPPKPSEPPFRILRRVILEGGTESVKPKYAGRVRQFPKKERGRAALRHHCPDAGGKARIALIALSIRAIPAAWLLRMICPMW